MTDWQDRVLAEKAELDDRIIKLATFLTNDNSNVLTMDEINVLFTQLHHMRQYSKILGGRIEKFK
jgi:hypothetical protein